MLFYPIRKDSQSHRQILTIDDQNLTVLDFLDSHLTRTTLVLSQNTARGISRGPNDNKSLGTGGQTKIAKFTSH
jgi:hypothetical protein